ncbi:hypothetical protein TeGR_g1385 [Tetraparma gracilis]|uniref:Uncharacterized protein n=1 Tax=Tetraparma gracilis TaxID=2962635 RepID=A0ABQ6M4V6_9STRA|nr:hypothetical protein TeGR_g1385 [Tetraparma gracilis]
MGVPCASYARSLSRDVFAELRAQLDAAVASLVSAYAELFLLGGGRRGQTREQKARRLMYHLNRGGGYFEVKEALKPCLQRVVAQAVPGSPLFAGGAPPLDTPEGGEFAARLFDFLAGELNKALMRGFVPGCVVECRESVAADIGVARNIPEKMVKLKMLAEDAEGNGEGGRADRRHAERVGMAKVQCEAEREGWAALWRAKADHAGFLLDAGLLERARDALREAAALKHDDAESLALLAAALVEIGAGPGEAGDVLLLLKGVADDANASVLEALLRDKEGSGPLARAARAKAAEKAREAGCKFEGREGVHALLSAADFLLAANLPAGARTCLAWAAEAELLAKEACGALGLPDACPAELRARRSLLAAALAARAGAPDLALCEDAERRNRLLPDCGRAKLLVAEALDKAGDGEGAVGKYVECLDALPAPVPYKVHVALYRLLAKEGRWEEAREVMFRAASTWKYASVWLNIAAASLKLGYLEDAEDSLQESNGADTNDGRSWGLFALVCLAGGEGRLGEANEALKQALSLGLDELGVLEELGERFVAIDQLGQAEAVYGRCVEVCDALGEGPRAAAFCVRKGKVLEGKREFEAAMGMYQEGRSRGAEGGELEALRSRLGTDM